MPFLGCVNCGFVTFGFRSGADERCLDCSRPLKPMSRFEANQLRRERVLAARWQRQAQERSG
jgi:hypothetical protein